MKNVKILAIETSCDETAAAVVENGTTILSNIISSQINLHKKYGGVVPEIAARAHIENIIPVIDEALTGAETDWGEIDAIAVTIGPGLFGSLIVGVETAKTLSLLKDKPLIGVHHMEGHIYANFVGKLQNPNNKLQTKIQRLTANNQKQPEFPLLVLTVSGGHTNIVYMKDHLNYEILGQTIDDAAGEAFDKVAKLLNLGYPGGPIISKLAEKGDHAAFNFPRTDLTPPPKRDGRGYLVQPKPSLDFSFSGLKTAVLNEARKQKQITNNKLLIFNFCASFQQAVVDILVRNTVNAVNLYKPKSVLLSGGVASNKELRKQLSKQLKANGEQIEFFVPPPILCTDNAAMIGAAAYQRFINNKFIDWQNLSADPNLKLT